MRSRDFWAILSGALGTIGAVALLSPESYHDPPSVAAPFATGAVLVVQALAAALALVLIWPGSSPSRPPAPGWWRILPIAGLLAAACAWSTLGPALTAHLAAWKMPGFALGRLGWSLALALPGVWWANSSLAADSDQTSLVSWPARFGLAALVAILVPAAQVADVATRHAHRAERLWAERRLAATIAAVEPLVALGSQTLVAGRTPAQLLLELDAERTRLEDWLATSPPAPTDLELAVRRGEALAQLGRLDEAARVVAPWTGSHEQAALLAAAVAQEQGDFVASSNHYLRAEELARAGLPSAASVPAQASHLETVVVRALRGRAFNERAQGRPRQAEALYRQGLREFPGAAQLHFDLALHYQQGGRPGDARREFLRAAELAPHELGAPARTALRPLAEQTPGCLLGPARSLPLAGTGAGSTGPAE